MAMSDQPVKQCPRCNADLADDAPQGLCPACLLEQAVAKPPAAADPAETAAHGSRFVAPSIDELNERFPQLEILELLGQGGMGAVYKARQRMLDRTVAIKILPMEVSRDPAFAERFTREARALAKLAHPNIVTVFEFGEQDGLYYLMMEFVDGVNLRDALKTQSLNPAEALTLISQICEALQYAHDEGVVHRDIKPENVLLDKRGRVKIADFGLAKLLGLSPIEVTLTATHQVMGTLHYMAPEQLERPLEVDHRADIYSLGVVFYELLTGELPLGRYKLPSEKRELDVRLDDVVLKTLEREPTQRYQHVSDVKIDVDQISSSDLKPPVVTPTPRPALSSRLPTVPFELIKDGIPLGHGVMRSESGQIVLEFEVTERTAMHPFYLNFKAGLHEVPIQLSDVSAIRLEQGWFSGKVALQTDSVRTVSGVPGADRGRVILSIAAVDLETAEQFVRCIGSQISGDVAVVSSKDKTSAGKGFHPGILGFGLIMILGGLPMTILGFVLPNPAFMWSGIGVMLGGPAIALGAFSKPNKQEAKFIGPHLGIVLMASVFVLTGSIVMIGAVVLRQYWLIWVGFGLVAGGGAVLCGAWELEKTEVVDQPVVRDDSPPQKPPKPAAIADDSTSAASRLKAPAIAMSVLGFIDCGLLAVVLIVAAFVADHPNSIPGTPGVIELLIIGGGSIFGLGELAGGVAMLTKRSYSLSIIGAICAVIPCSLIGIIKLPFGIWSLVVLNSSDVRREYQLAAERRQQEAFEREEN